MSIPDNNKKSSDSDSRNTSPQVWAFSGGKGGVGRSFLAANLAVQIARSGKRVVLIDADVDAPTLHAFLGQSSSGGGLTRFFENKSISLTECIQKAPFGDLWFARGVDGPVRGVSKGLDRLVIGIRELETEYVILDLGSSRSPSIQKIFAIADSGIVVVTPELLTLQGAYGYLSQLEARGEEEERREPGNATRRPWLGIVVNQMRSAEENFSGIALRSGLRKVLGMASKTLGSIPYDAAVIQALGRGRPLSLQYPNSPAALSICSLLANLESASINTERNEEGGPEDLADSNHYQILEIPKQASPRQIQANYEALKKIYSPASPFLPGAVDTDQLQKITKCVEQAYRTLIFLETRREYDRRSLPPSTVNPAAKPGKGDPISLDPEKEEMEIAGEEPEISEDEFSGAVLRRVREQKKIPLDHICEITKIRKVHLECIEEENYSDLPPAVFLRGFIRAFAQCLGLDPDEVCVDYMNRYQEWELSRQDPLSASHPDYL